MKTPMQEHIEWMQEKLRILVEYKDLSAGTEVDECIQHAEAMLEKEKEVAQQYAEFAIECDRKELPVLEFDEWINLPEGTEELEYLCLEDEDWTDDQEVDVR